MVDEQLEINKASPDIQAGLDIRRDAMKFWLWRLLTLCLIIGIHPYTEA